MLRIVAPSLVMVTSYEKGRTATTIKRMDSLVTMVRHTYTTELYEHYATNQLDFILHHGCFSIPELMLTPISLTIILSRPTGPREDLTMLAIEEAARTITNGVSDE